MASVTLSEREAQGLLDDLLEGINALEWGEEMPEAWCGVMKLWVELILNRMEFGK